MTVSVACQRTRRAAAVAALLISAAGAPGCGKKGPPLAPLRLVPSPVSEVAARRTAEAVELSFTLPTQNQNGPGPVELDRVEIYAVTVAAGGPTPPNRDLLTSARLVGTVPVKPAPREGEAPPDPADLRPSPGDRAVFREAIGPPQLQPQLKPEPARAAPTAAPPAAATTATGTAAATADPAAADPAGAKAAASAAAQEPAVPYPVRVYALRGITRGGRPGPPAARVTIPLVDLPPPPAALDARYTETLYQLTWIPAVTDIAQDSVTFNVYTPGATAALNPQPLTAAAFEHGPVRFGEERCFTVRAVRTLQSVPIESAASAPACVTASDTFPPAAPQGLQAVAGPDGVSLSWNANAEADLAGYVVLRGEPGGDTLRPLTQQPITETSFRDTTVTSGAQYVYAVVAVDKASPPNASAQSARQEVTAR